MAVTLAHNRKDESGSHESMKNRTKITLGFLVSRFFAPHKNKTHARKDRTAEIASPPSDPRSLRRHYPHQVQGVVQSDLSAIAAPPHFLQNRTRNCEVNGRDIALRCPDAAVRRPYLHGTMGSD